MSDPSSLGFIMTESEEIIAVILMILAFHAVVFTVMMQDYCKDEE